MPECESGHLAAIFEKAAQPDACHDAVTLMDVATTCECIAEASLKLDELPNVDCMFNGEPANDLVEVCGMFEPEDLCDEEGVHALLLSHPDPEVAHACHATLERFRLPKFPSRRPSGGPIFHGPSKSPTSGPIFGKLFPSKSPTGSPTGKPFFSRFSPTGSPTSTPFFDRFKPTGSPTGKPFFSRFSP